MSSIQVILLEKIGHLGNLGDPVKVKPGFARNYLIPQGKAIPATAENMEVVKKRRAELEKAAAEKLTAAQERARQLLSLGTVTVAAKAADEGRLYGSLGTRELAEAITKAGVKAEKSEILLPNGALRQIGEHEIHLQLHSDVDATIKINVVAEA